MSWPSSRARSGRREPSRVAAHAAAWRVAALAAASLCAACPLDVEGRPCAGQADCIDGYSCVDAVCVASTAPSECVTVVDCAAGFDCEDDVCAQRAADERRALDEPATGLAGIGIAAAGGAVRVVGVAAADDVTVAALVSLTPTTSGRSDEVTFTGEVVGDTLEIVVAKPDEAAFADVVVDLDVRAPPSLAFAMRGASNGPVALHGLRGGAVVDPTGEPAGAITGEGLAGPITLRTFSQAIDVGFQMTGDVTLSSETGDVVARVPAGSSMLVGAQTFGAGTVTLQGVSVVGDVSSTAAAGYAGSPAAATFTLTITTSGDITIIGE